MKTTWNPVMFIGTGFEYSIIGTESGGYKVTIMGRKLSHRFTSLEYVHRRINMEFADYMKTV